MELVKYIYDIIDNQYPNKCIVGAAEREIDDSILIYEIDFNNTKTKENERVGESAVIQITRHQNTLAELIILYNWCIENLVPDKVNVQSCVIEGRGITTFTNGLYRMDIRIMLSK